MILVLKPSTKCEQISNKHFLALKCNSDSLVLGQNGREIDKEAMESLCFSQDDARREHRPSGPVRSRTGAIGGIGTMTISMAALV